MEYVSFRLGKEIYAVDIWHAREIVDAPPLSRLPNAPAWIPGLINLRGRILPVVDLKKKFGLADEPLRQSAQAYIVVVELPSEQGEPMSVGMLADAVLEVFDVPASELDPPPKFGARFSRDYLLGMAKRAAGIVAIMDAPRVLADADAIVDADEQSSDGKTPDARRES
jgi:purine-binding chemotaxis protein CheW